MNWAGTINVNHKALARVLAGLLALVGLTSGGLVLEVCHGLTWDALQENTS